MDLPLQGGSGVRCEVNVGLPRAPDPRPSNLWLTSSVVKSSPGEQVVAAVLAEGGAAKRACSFSFAHGISEAGSDAVTFPVTQL